MGNLSKNFNRHEFVCRCGCNQDYVVMRLVDGLQELRDFNAIPVHVISGYRCHEHNKIVGGRPQSQHLLCHAADIRINGVDPRDIARAAALIPVFKKGGIGVYRWGCHLDVGTFQHGRPARWGLAWKEKKIKTVKESKK